MKQITTNIPQSNFRLVSIFILLQFILGALTIVPANAQQSKSPVVIDTMGQYSPSYKRCPDFTSNPQRNDTITLSNALPWQNTITFLAADGYTTGILKTYDKCYYVSFISENNGKDKRGTLYIRMRTISVVIPALADFIQSTVRGKVTVTGTTEICNDEYNSLCGQDNLSWMISIHK